MRYGTTPRWVYLMLIVMGLGFVAGAGAFVMFVPAPTGGIVGAIWFVMGAGMAFFSYRALAKVRDDDRIARTGSAATATLLSAKTTGWVINSIPQWALRLRIDGYGASYETTMKLLTYSPPANGATFAVRVDPARREHVVMAADAPDGGDASNAPAGAGSVPGLTPQVEAAMLAALQKAGLTNAGATSVTNPDGSRTVTSTTFTVGGDASIGAATNGGDAQHSAAETVKLLADLDRMHASGALGDAEFDTLKRKLLGES